MRLYIIGLGNPGKKYELTRHNAGILTLEKMASESEGKWQRSSLYDSLEMTLKGQKLSLIKPKTFMNNCGDIISALKLDAEEIEKSLFVADDFGLKFGFLRFRRSGSSGGHKGFSSLEKYAGKKYQRLRIGIGPLPEGVDPAEFVLSPFDAEQRETLTKVLDKSVCAVKDWADMGIDYAMNKYNRRDFSKEDNRK
ncbi:aminoacyl-tRNA hydrolase [candidate division WOR-3 bacterium]|nr:aminoacyl-tRNA hydrolase [candidate division WOR-3 bacterium]